MNIYIYKLTSRSCPSARSFWAVRATSAEEASQWHKWVNAPRHDGAILIKEIKYED